MLTAACVCVVSVVVWQAAPWANNRRRRELCDGAALYVGTQNKFRDERLPREYGRLLTFDCGESYLQQLAAALEVTSRMMSDEAFKLPLLHGLNGTLQEVRRRTRRDACLPRSGASSPLVCCSPHCHAVCVPCDATH